MPISNYPKGFANGLNVRGMPILNSYGGDIYWVDSGDGSDGNKGTFDRPFATIDYAIGQCTGSNGDIIMVKPGHSETSLSSSIEADVAGVSIVGLGNGDNRPVLGGIATDEVIDITADDVAIKNIRFSALTSGTQAGSRKITIDSDSAVVEGCEFQCGASDDNAVYVTYQGDNSVIFNNAFEVSADGPDTAIYLEGATGGDSLTKTVIKANFFNGGTANNSWDEGVIYSSGVHTQCLIDDNNFLYISGGVGGVEFTAAATGLIRDNFFGGGTLGSMLDPGSCYCSNNKEADAVDENARTFPRPLMPVNVR